MNKLQVEIDEENETLTELYDEKNKAEEKKQKAAIEALLVSSFGKTYFWKHQTLDVTLPTTRIMLVPVLIESDKCISAKWIQFQILWFGQLSFSNFFCSTLVTNVRHPFIMVIFSGQIRRKRPSTSHVDVTVLCWLSELCGGWRTRLLSVVKDRHHPTQPLNPGFKSDQHLISL